MSRTSDRERDARQRLSLTLMTIVLLVSSAAFIIVLLPYAS